MLWEHKKGGDFNLSLTQDMEIKENTSYTDKKGNTYGVHCFKTWKYDIYATYDCFFYFINKTTFIRIEYKIKNSDGSISNIKEDDLKNYTTIPPTPAPKSDPDSD